MKRSLMEVVGSDAASQVQSKQDMTIELKGSLAQSFGKALSIMFDKSSTVPDGEPAPSVATENMTNGFLYGQVKEQAEASDAENLIIYTIDESNLDDPESINVMYEMGHAAETGDDFMLVMATPNDIPSEDPKTLARIHALESLALKAGFKVVSKRTK